MENMDIVMGIERETHRVTIDGAISGSPQTAALRPPHFTKDFAESQLEIVTKPHARITDLLLELETFTERARAAVLPEVLWPFSMPPRLPPDSGIPIAELGPGKAAREAMGYRSGLALRYGKPRQMICGVHLNVSIGVDQASEILREHPPGPTESEARPMDALYIRLARNLYKDLRHLILLTGASPVPGGLSMDGYGEAVSYRNSALGYAGSEFRPYLDLTSLASYAAGIRRGLETESDRFKSLGARRGGLKPSTRVFQSEKEFYAPVRLKGKTRERGLHGLSMDGIEYVELRFLDVDPFSPLGISGETLRLAHLFILDNVTKNSGAGTQPELGAWLDEADAAALLDPMEPATHGAFGTPRRDGAAFSDLLGRTRRRLESLEPIARELARNTGDGYLAVLDGAIRQTEHPALLPSARLLSALADCGGDWTRLGIEIEDKRRNAA